MTDNNLQAQLSSTQKGAIGEMLLAAALTHYSGGQLCCFQPIADDDGIDLLIYNKNTRLTLSLQVKSRIIVDPAAGGTLQFDVREATWAANETGYLACIVMNDLTVTQGWLVPLAKLPEIANHKKGKYILTPSRSERSKDRYCDYRLDSLELIVQQIVALTAEQG